VGNTKFGETFIDTLLVHCALKQRKKKKEKKKKKRKEKGE
jgi:hypothetical protein